MNGTVHIHKSTANCSRAEESVMVAPLPTLHEGGLPLEDLHRLLQTSNLGRAPLPARLIRLWLRDAAVVDLREVLEDCTLLLSRRGPVRSKLGNALIQRLCLLVLVLDILILKGFRDFVCLRLLVVLRLGICLRCFLFGKICCKVRLANFQDSNDASPCASRRLVFLRHGWLLHQGGYICV